MDGYRPYPPPSQSNVSRMLRPDTFPYGRATEGLDAALLLRLGLPLQYRLSGWEV